MQTATKIGLPNFICEEGNWYRGIYCLDKWMKIWLRYTRSSDSQLAIYLCLWKEGQSGTKSSYFDGTTSMNAVHTPGGTTGNLEFGTGLAAIYHSIGLYKTPNNDPQYSTSSHFEAMCDSCDYDLCLGLVSADPGYGFCPLCIIYMKYIYIYI